MLAETVAAVADLNDAGLPTVPHVAARLVRVLRDPVAIRQTAALLSDAQRRGRMPLPDPLPLASAVVVRCAPVIAALSERERALVLHAAILTSDSLDVLLEACGWTLPDLIASRVSAIVAPIAGHARFTDPAMRVFAHESAPLAVRTAAHARLAQVYARRGEPGLHAWHRALSTLGGNACLTAPLVAFAADALAHGDADRAFAIAREASAHRADAQDLADADALLAAAAGHAGYADAAAGAQPEALVAVRSPVAVTRDAMATVLDLARAGDIAASAQACLRALADGPFLLPFGGAGVAVARRLGMLAGGDLGRIVPALEAAAPVPPSTRVRWESIVDAELSARQRGDLNRAQALAGVAAERVAQLPAGVSYLPGSDAPLAGTPSRMPDDARLAARVRTELTEADSVAEVHRIIETSFGIRSPFERARTELELARACLRLGQHDRAEAAVYAAEQWFAAAGVPTWQEAIGRLLAEIDAARDSPSDDDAFGDCRLAWAPILTERELEVALLVAEGLSNGEVAQRLFVSPRTVEVHLRRIFAKLGVHSRVEVSVLAHRARRVAPQVAF